MRLTTKQLAEIEARSEAATPGSWRVEEGTTLVWGDCNPDDTTSYGMGYPVALVELEKRRWAKKELPAEANAEFIARARQDIPDLIAHVRSLEAEIERLNAWLPTAESAVVAEISMACNENAERAERAEAKLATILDQAWEAVNVLGAPDTAVNLWQRGYCDAILDALKEIEKLGGMQPKKRKG